MIDKRNTRRGGFYWHPETNRPYVTVTTAKNVIKKEAIETWQMKQVWAAMVKDPNLSQQEALMAPTKSLNQAGVRGTDIHTMTELLDKDPNINNLPDKFKPFEKQANAYLKFKKDRRVKYINSELTVYDDEYGFAGTLDRLAQMDGDGDVIIMDFKTNKAGAIYPDVAIQLSAYKHAYNKLPSTIKATKLVGVGFSPEGNYQVQELPDIFPVFLACKKIWEWQNSSLLKDVGYYDWF